VTVTAERTGFVLHIFSIHWGSGTYEHNALSRNCLRLLICDRL
jgi:hypothetical protein